MVADRFVSVPMTSEVERRDAMGQIFQENVPINARTVWLRPNSPG